MRRWIELAAQLYPRSWREEYGDEFAALLDDVRASRACIPECTGRGDQNADDEGNELGEAGGRDGGGRGDCRVGNELRGRAEFRASAVIAVTPQADPVRPVSPEVLDKRSAQRLAAIEGEILSRTSLADIVVSLGLYQKERSRMPLEDVLEQMREKIRIEARPPAKGGLSPIVLSISVRLSRQGDGLAAVRDPCPEFTRANATSNRNEANMYVNSEGCGQRGCGSSRENHAVASASGGRHACGARCGESAEGVCGSESRRIFSVGARGGTGCWLVRGTRDVHPRGVRRLAGFVPLCPGWRGIVPASRPVHVDSRNAGHSGDDHGRPAGGAPGRETCR